MYDDFIRLKAPSPELLNHHYMYIVCKTTYYLILIINHFVSLNSNLTSYTMFNSIYLHTRLDLYQWLTLNVMDDNDM